MFVPNHIPRSVELIENQLRQLSKVKNSINYDVEFDFATQLLVDSIGTHENDLIEELKAAKWLESQYDMELSLERLLIDKNALPMTILSKFFDIIQNLCLASAENATGTKHEVGRFSNDLVTENQLMVKCTTVSSFAIQIFYACPSSPNLFRTERLGESLFLYLLSGDNVFDGFSLDSISGRLLNRYQSLLDFLLQNSLTISTRTRKHPFSVKLTPDNARNLKHLINYNLSTAKQIEEEIAIEGILMMGNLKRQSFMIQTNSSNYTGQISEDGIIGLKLIPLGSNVIAKLLATYPSEESDKPAYLLLSIDKSTI
jgi:hypothetical protein